MKITQNIKAIVLALVLTIGMGYVSAAWTDPTSNPPAGNVAAPINIGDSAQTKTGALTLLHLFTPDLTLTSSSPITPGQVMIAADATGKVKWADVPPTQSVNCSFVGNTSNISLNGNNSGNNVGSGNNNGIVVNVGSLPAGTYTITGSGQTYNSGGGGWAGVVLSSTALTYSQISSTLNSRWGSPVTSGTGSTYKFYYNSDNADTIVMNKRNALNDGEFTVPSSSVTIAGTKYIYVVLGQAAISGSLTISGGSSVCGGAGTSSGGGINFLNPSVSLGNLTNNNTYAEFTMSNYGATGAKTALVYITSEGYAENAGGIVYGNIGAAGNEREMRLHQQYGGGKDTSNPNAGNQAWLPVIDGKIKLKTSVGATAVFNVRLLGYMN